MTLMLHWRLSIRCDEKFMRPRHTQNRSVQNSLASERREIYFRLRHTTHHAAIIIIVSRNSKTCVQVHCAPQRGRNKFMRPRWQGCACLQHFSSADLCGGCPEFQFARADHDAGLKFLFMYACASAVCMAK